MSESQLDVLHIYSLISQKRNENAEQGEAENDERKKKCTLQELMIIRQKKLIR